MEWERGNGEIWRRGQEIGISIILQVDSCLWKESKQKNANKEGMGLCNRDKKEVYTKEEKGISVVKEREGRGAQVYGRTIEEMIYQTLKVTSNGTCVFIRNKNDKKCIV